MQSHKSGRGGCVLLCADKTVQPLRLLPIPTSPSAIHRLRDPTSRPYFPWGAPLQLLLCLRYRCTLSPALEVWAWRVLPNKDCT